MLPVTKEMVSVMLGEKAWKEMNVILLSDYIV
jgi:hypothetical protein